MRFASPPHHARLASLTALVVHLINEHSEARALLHERRRNGERHRRRRLRGRGRSTHVLAVIVHDDTAIKHKNHSWWVTTS